MDKWKGNLIWLWLMGIGLMGCERFESSMALGTLERDRVALTATASEIVVALPVREGAFVQAGDLLVQLDDKLQQAVVERADAQVAQARASLDKLRHGARPEELAAAKAKVSGALAALNEAEASYSRIRNLSQQQLVSQAELDRARASKESADASYQSAQEALLTLTNGTRIEDLTAAEAALKAALASLKIEQELLAKLAIRATRSGLLDTLPWNLGERVTQGSPVAVLLAGDAPYARVYIPEPYRVRLRVGDSLTVHIDGLENPVTGKLQWISNEPAFTPYYALNQHERSRLMYLAKVQLPQAHSDLPIGMPAQVELP